MLETLEKLKDGTAVRIKQNDNESSYAPMLSKEMGKIEFTKNAAEIEQWVRGLNPWPSAYTELGGKTLKIWDADVVSYDGGERPGTIIEVTKKQMIVACGQEALALNEIQLSGKKRMSVQAFLAGSKVDAGTVLGE